MGWLRKLIAGTGGEPGVAVEAGIAEDEADLVEIDVVGEASYQPELARVAGPKGEQGKRHRVGVTLRHDPQNQYDSNAVRVEVMGLLVGFLPRSGAARVGPRLAAAGGAVEGHGVIVGGWSDGHSEGHYGIRVWLTPEDARRVGAVRATVPQLPPVAPGEVRLSPDERSPDAPVSSVTVTCEEHYQSVIEATRPREWDRDWWPCLVTLAFAMANPHSRSGGPCIEVLLGGQTAGYLTDAMTERHRAGVQRVVDAGSVASVRAQVTKGTKGGREIWRIKLAMTPA